VIRREGTRIKNFPDPVPGEPYVSLGILDVSRTPIIVSQGVRRPSAGWRPTSTTTCSERWPPREGCLSTFTSIPTYRECALVPAALPARGFSEADLRKLLGANAQRVFAAATR
jgi:hypothetical protein